MLFRARKHVVFGIALLRATTTSAESAKKKNIRCRCALDGQREANKGCLRALNAKSSSTHSGTHATPTPVRPPTCTQSHNRHQHSQMHIRAEGEELNEPPCYLFQASAKTCAFSRANSGESGHLNSEQVATKLTEQIVRKNGTAYCLTRPSKVEARRRWFH